MSYNSVKDIFNAFNELKILVLGDSMIDTYVYGSIERNSPEAPIPVLRKSHVEKRLGGAANVAMNLKNLGINTILCSVVGTDENARIFKSLLAENELCIKGIFKDESRPTTEKSRYVNNNLQLLRVDSESGQLLEGHLKKLIRNFVLESLQDIDAIIFQDYDKGVFSDDLIATIVAQCNQQNIPVIVDPKERNFFSYKNVTLFKPNKREVEKALGEPIDPFSPESLLQTYQLLKQKLGFDSLILTLSENGIVAANDQAVERFAADQIQVADVSGAGDTVVAVAAICVALNLSLAMTARLSNLAGGLVCEKAGVTAIDKNEFLAAALDWENITGSSYS